MSAYAAWRDLLNRHLNETPPDDACILYLDGYKEENEPAVALQIFESDSKIECIEVIRDGQRDGFAPRTEFDQSVARPHLSQSKGDMGGGEALGVAGDYSTGRFQCPNTRHRIRKFVVSDNSTVDRLCPVWRCGMPMTPVGGA